MFNSYMYMLYAFDYSGINMKTEGRVFLKWIAAAHCFFSLVEILNIVFEGHNSH